MAESTLAFNILARDKASPAFDKVSKAADRTEKRFGFLAARSNGLTAGMTAGFGKIVGAMAAVATVQVFKGFIDEARESRRVGALTESIIKSTGGAAKISSKQVGALATAISNKTGVDDEAIQSGSNLLLTFKNVRNEVGKGANVFDRATQAAVDLSAAGFGDVNGASKMLGKALNDPLKGLTALGKAGVTFTEDQKKQIKTLVETGKTLEAQKIILKEVESQVGGAAAASADPMQKLGVIVGNAKEAIGTAFLPIIDKAAGLLGRVLPAAVDKASTGFSALGAAFREGDVTSDGFVGVMERIGVTARTVFDYFKANILPVLKDFGGFIVNTAAPALATFATNIGTTLGPAIKDVFGFFKTDVLPRLKDFGSFLGESVLPKVGQLATSLSKNKDFLVPFAATIVTVIAAMKAWAVVQGVLNVVMSANPIGLVVVAIAALVGGLVYAYKHSEKFREIVDRVGLSAATTFVGIGRAVLGLVKVMMPALKFMTMGFLDFVGGILTAAAKVDNALGGKLGLQKASDAFNKFKETAGKAFDGAAVKAGQWDKSLAATQKTLILKANIQDLESKLKTAKTGLADKNLTKERRAQLVATIKDLESKLTTAHTKLDAGWITKARISKLQADKKDLDNKIRDAKTALDNPKLTATKKAKLTADIKELQNRARTAQTTIDNLRGKTVSVEIKYTSGGVNLTAPSSVGRRAFGGPIHGPGSGTSDQAGLWALSNNEHVWTAKEVAAAGGHAAVERMRKDVLSHGRGLAKGGRPGATFQSTFDAASRRGALNKALLDSLGGGGSWTGGGGLGRQIWRGKTLNGRTIQMILAAERILGAVFRITQGSWSTRVAASGSTHAGGGVIDTNGPRSWGAAESALRRVGFAAWHRTPSQGPWNDHIHAVALGDPTASPSAKRQMASFRRGGNGLGGYKRGTPWVPADQLAYLHKGEAVIPAEANRSRLSAGRGGGDVHIHLHGTEQQLMNQLMRKLDDLRRQGRLRIA